jgi:WD40 repeat protein
LQDHYSAVTSLSFTPEGNWLLTAGRDKVANLWDLATSKKLATVPVFEAIEGELAFWEQASAPPSVVGAVSEQAVRVLVNVNFFRDF